MKEGAIIWLKHEKLSPELISGRASEPANVQLIPNGCINGFGNLNTAIRQRIDATKVLIRILSMADATDKKAARKKLEV